MLLRRCGGGVTASRPVGMASAASASDWRPSEGSASPRGLFSGLGGRALFLLRWPVHSRLCQNPSEPRIPLLHHGALSTVCHQEDFRSKQALQL